MNLIYNEFVDIFEEKFVAPTYQEWRVEGKSGKDTVGKNFELFNRFLYELYDIPLLDNKNKILGTKYNPDIAIGKDNDNVIIVEEDKGHYLDLCFLDRGAMNAAKVFRKCVEENKSAPFFVISCVTSYSLYDEVIKEDVNLFNDHISILMQEHLLYFPLCAHDRVNENYFTENKSPFKLDQKLVEERLNFFYRIKNGMK